MRTSSSMRTPRGRSASVWSIQVLNSRISAREVSSDFRRSDLWSRQNIAFRSVTWRVALRTSAIAAFTSALSAGRRLLRAGKGVSVTRGRVLPMFGSSGTCRPKFHELPRPGSQSARTCVPWPQDAAAPQRHGERQDERSVLALDVVVDAGLQVERAQLEQRARRRSRRRAPSSRPGIPRRSRPCRRSTASGPVDAEVRPASALRVVPGAVEAVEAARERLPHRRLPIERTGRSGSKGLSRLWAAARPGPVERRGRNDEQKRPRTVAPC